jgi:hypothetical protein
MSVVEAPQAASESRKVELDPKGRYRALPKPVRIADTVETHDASPPPDPTMGRDPDRDFLLRYAG